MKMEYFGHTIEWNIKKTDSQEDVKFPNGIMVNGEKFISSKLLRQKLDEMECLNASQVFNKIRELREWCK
jgi:hypothetical protein